jgi:hypothetical protein
MDSDDEVVRKAQAVSEGTNWLGALVCGPAFRRYRAQATKALQRWETDYAPVIRELAPGMERVDQARLRATFDKVSAIAKAGVDIDAPEQLAALRSAIREALRAFGVALPDLTPDESAVCELHGFACPLLERSGE